MKKHILAMACLTALGAHAQSSVTLYGSIDMGLTWTRNGSGTTLAGGGVNTPASLSKFAVDSGIGPGSRVGFRGREDLGSGLAAIFTAEMGVDASSGASQQGGLLFGRQVFVGLASKNWTLTAGRQYSPLNVAFGSTDVMVGFYWGNPVNSSGHGAYQPIGAAAASGGAFGSSARVNNSVQGTYTVGPVTGKLMWGAGDEIGNSKAGRLINPAISYTDGPLSVHASYLWMQTPAAMLVAGAAPQKMKEGVIGATYNFGVAKVGGGYYQFRGPQNRTLLAPVATVGATGASPFAYNWDKTQMVYLGAQVPVGAHRFSGSAARQSYDYAIGPDGRSWAVGALYEYFLSKRSNFYVSTGKVINDERSRKHLGATITTIVPNGFGSDPVAFSMGIQHRF